MNTMVMDVEGTDGRERGEDQVRASDTFLTQPQLLTTYSPRSAGLRAEVRSVLACIFGSPHCQFMGTPSRPVPGRKHGIAQDSI